MASTSRGESQVTAIRSAPANTFRTCRLLAYADGQLPGISLRYIQAMAYSIPKNTHHIRLHETHRLPLLRPLDAIAAVADALGVRCAAAIDRARRRGRGARRRRGLFPRPSLRPPARLAVPATGGVRRADEADRDRHGGHRHALREPAVHGGGRRRRRSHRRRPPAARHQPRLARAGDRWLSLLRLRPAGGDDRCRHGAAPHRGFPRGAARQGLRQTQPAPDVSEPAGPPASRALFAGPARAYLVGRRHQRDGGMGGQARHEPAKLDAQDRRERQAVPCAAGGADPALSCSVEEGRARAHPAGVGLPQHLRAGRRARPHVFRARQRVR